MATLDPLHAWPAALDDDDVDRALAAQLAQMPGAALVALDRAARKSSTSSSHAVRIPTLADVARARTGALVMVSMARDGRVREAATVRLVDDKSALATHALFVRVDDTFPAIRARAADAIERRAVPERARDFIDLLDLLDTSSGRTARSTEDGNRAKAAVRDLLLSDGVMCRGAVDDALRSTNTYIRTAASRFAVVEGSDEQRLLDVFTRALADWSPHVRLSAARRALDAVTPVGVVRKVAPLLAQDRLAAVRTCAVHAASRAGAVLVLERLTRDRNGGVRALARSKLGRAGGEVEREHVRDELAHAEKGERIVACLAALSEIGRPEDFAWIARFLHDERARVQAEAVRALIGVHASGGLESFVDVLHDKLTHDSGRVAFESARGLALLPRELVRTDVVTARLSQDIRARRLRRALEALS